MRQPPTDVSDAHVLETLRTHWHVDVDAVEHVPLGFGAHHWRASCAGRPVLFATLDRPRAGRPAERYEQAYALAARLVGQGLDFVLAGRPTTHGSFTAPCSFGTVLSAVPWVDGVGGRHTFRDEHERGATERMVDALHAVPTDTSMPRWTSAVPADLAASLTALVAEPWSAGPHGETARELVRARLAGVLASIEEHRTLLAEAWCDVDAWVVTHGEPMPHNQLVTSSGQRYLVDWESVAVAPRERDLRPLVHGGSRRTVHPGRLRLFDLDWCLDEVDQYSRWFAGPHGDGEDDRIALNGLREELART
jgi:spectinomycin phosphotransferase